MEAFPPSLQYLCPPRRLSTSRPGVLVSLPINIYMFQGRRIFCPSLGLRKHYHQHSTINGKLPTRPPTNALKGHASPRDSSHPLFLNEPQLPSARGRCYVSTSLIRHPQAHPQDCDDDPERKEAGRDIRPAPQKTVFAPDVETDVDDEEDGDEGAQHKQRPRLRKTRPKSGKQPRKR